jgi:hypothetical protein
MPLRTVCAHISSPKRGRAAFSMRRLPCSYATGQASQSSRTLTATCADHLLKQEQRIRPTVQTPLESKVDVSSFNRSITSQDVSPSLRPSAQTANTHNKPELQGVCGGWVKQLETGFIRLRIRRLGVQLLLGAPLFQEIRHRQSPPHKYA